MCHFSYFGVDDSVALSTFTLLYNHHHYLSTELFPSSKIETVPITFQHGRRQRWKAYRTSVPLWFDEYVKNWRTVLSGNGGEIAIFLWNGTGRKYLTYREIQLKHIKMNFRFWLYFIINDFIEFNLVYGLTEKINFFERQ